jgi:hypothetical protein
MFAGVEKDGGRVTERETGTRVVGIAAIITDDRTNANVLVITLMSETANCVMRSAELYKESLDSTAEIVTIPGCNSVTAFPVTVAMSVFEDVYVHVPVLSLGLLGSVIVNVGLVSDVFGIIIVPT